MGGQETNIITDYVLKVRLTESAFHSTQIGNNGLI